jgi:secreted trypsin-like serine protease
VSATGFCSAVVLAPDVLLTAAHCVAAGEHRAHWRDGETPVLAAIRDKAVHPGYEPKAVEARRRSVDLALVRLAEPLPARFVPARLSAEAAPQGATVRVAGFGVTAPGERRSGGTLRTVDLPVVEPYGPSRILLWARGEGGACTGDSGGPMLRGEAVVAITSWAAGPRGRGCGGLTQGILVAPQRDWIERTLAAWGRGAGWSLRRPGRLPDPAGEGTFPA